jgi:hypothetical protein
MKLTETRIDDPTPNGGTYSIAYWKGSEGQPVEQKNAVAGEIVEFNADDKAVFRTYFKMEPKSSDR